MTGRPYDDWEKWLNRIVNRRTPEQEERARRERDGSWNLEWFGPDVYGPDWDVPSNCEACVDYMLRASVQQACLDAMVGERSFDVRLSKMKELVEAYHANGHTEESS